MFDFLKNILFLIPIMIYYFIESIILALFINLVWKLILQSKFNIYLSYLDWVAIIWIIKVVFFDIFKLLGNFFNVIYEKIEGIEKDRINKQNNSTGYNTN
jgi:hypothetical protein